MHIANHGLRWICRVALATLMLVFAATLALAFEPGAHPPFVGSSAGVPIGVIPRSGFYLGSLTTYEEDKFKPDSRPRHPNTLSLFSEGVTLTWVPDIDLWGARYAASVAQPVVVATVTNIPPRGTTVTESGLGNTGISPLNLAWTLRTFEVDVL